MICNHKVFYVIFFLYELKIKTFLISPGQFKKTELADCCSMLYALQLESIDGDSVKYL